MSLPRLVRLRAFISPLQTRPQTLPCLLTRRNASAKAPNESTRPLVLEQPDKFRPPSHGARKPRKPRHFGPSLTDEEIKEQATKRYPHSMPPEGTVMRKFLESRGIHVWITMSVLISLTGFVLLTDFKTKNKFPELLPQGSLFWSNPFSFVQQYFAVYKLHSAAYMAEQQEKRARNLDEARKRKEYLIAHGIEKEGLFGFGTVEGDARKEKRRREREATVEERIREEDKEELIGGNVNETREETAKKANKWFGIW
ncbi:Vacuolar import and degradation protein 27 [Venturia nashicola]|uniref:Vacuolar import and degradation protein 27 n=1 Tax=Venturia nashicola TaxID=86259 RepID=A0A4Z1PFZ0_9PEZI|nr:Vacuolar import and degradation protein 27 [Venturia nashicola]TLD34929.1 Vacuolar import and degradation protein 27 [Venturia nashicola]